MVDWVINTEERTPASPQTSLTLKVPPASDGALPKEADVLYGRVRGAEGTARGSGFVYYGGDEFTPGKEHPGDAAKRNGPKGETHAAGPGQWQPGTWNGLKPDFEKRFGRLPDFSNDDDHKRMTWLNAAKIYPGGEEKMRADIAAGKLDTSALAPQWSGFGGGGWAVTQAGKWKVSPNAIAFEQGRNNSSVVWMSPDDYLGMVPESGDKNKRRSLLKSLSLGDDIEAIPTLDAKEDGGRLKIFDQDGRNRARVAKEEGVGLIPVAVHGVGKDTPSWIEDMRGNVRPFNFSLVPKSAASASPTGAILGASGAPEVGHDGVLSHIVGAAQKAVRQTAELPAGAVMGAARPLVGAGQLVAHGAEKMGVPGAGSAAGMMDSAASGLESAIGGLSNPDARGMAAVGDIGASMTVPASKIASLPRLLRPVGAAALGGAMGASQPVTGGDYWDQVKSHGITGAALGGALQGAGEAANAAVNMAKRFVTRGTVTNAAARILGENTRELTPEVMDRVRKRIGAELERIESTHDVHLDNDLVSDLVGASDRARDLLGTESKPIETAIDNILSRARGNGIIPAKSAATLWHKGSRLDNLTESRNPDLSSLAMDVQSAVRRALNRQLPPDEAAAYSAARHQWRDMKIVEKSLRPGQTQVSPERLVTQVARRFPNNAYLSDAQAPPMLRLGRSVGETWAPGTGRYGGPSMGILGAVVGEHLLPGVGGMVGGGIAGTISGHLLLDKLSRGRLASGNAMAALRPPASPSAALSLGQFAAPAATIGTMPNPMAGMARP